MKTIFKPLLLTALFLLVGTTFAFAAGDKAEGISFGFWDVVEILGSLAFFIYGMKLMSDGIQRAAGSQMRNILRTMTKNRYLGVFTGFLITALVQSSSATTVMTVSFVNANLLSLVESAGVMMGANIGTTITGWIVSMLGLKLKLAAYSIPIFAVGLPMLLGGKGKLKHWGEFLIGFAILFLGLSYLKGAVPDLKHNPEVLDFLANFTDWGFFSRLFFVLVGAVVTIVVQSSSAAMAITLTLCAQGILPIDVAAAMILGENIGTTVTAELASLVGNTNAKRSARIHSIFNLIGVTWMVILLPVVLPLLVTMVQWMFGTGDPYTNPADIPVTLAAFHTVFNITNVLLLLAFVPWLVKIAIKTVPEKKKADTIDSLQFIDSANRTPELATVELQQEIARYGEITSRMLGFSRELINTSVDKERYELIKRIKRYEEITDSFEIEITEYITNLSDQAMTHKTSVRLRSFFNVCNDLERIGDIFYQISKTVQDSMRRDIFLLPEQRTMVNDLLDIVEEAFTEMNTNLQSVTYDDISLQAAYALEDRINVQRNAMRKFNRDNVNNEDYSPNSAMAFSNLFSSIERVGDHIVNINESAAGEI